MPSPIEPTYAPKVAFIFGQVENCLSDMDTHLTKAEEALAKALEFLDKLEK